MKLYTNAIEIKKEIDNIKRANPEGTDIFLECQCAENDYTNIVTGLNGEFDVKGEKVRDGIIALKVEWDLYI
jgi:hypothetical protein